MKTKVVVKKAMFTTIAVAALLIFLTAGAGLCTEWPKDVTVVSPAPGASVHMVLVGIGKAVEKHTPIENWIVQPAGRPKALAPSDEGRKMPVRQPQRTRHS